MKVGDLVMRSNRVFRPGLIGVVLKIERRKPSIKRKGHVYKNNILTVLRSDGNVQLWNAISVEVISESR